MLRKKLTILVAAALMVVASLAASPAWADPGNGQGVGQGRGGGDGAHSDNGNHNAKGGGKQNNPHACFTC